MKLDFATRQRTRHKTCDMGIVLTSSLCFRMRNTRARDHDAIQAPSCKLKVHRHRNSTRLVCNASETRHVCKD